MALVNFKNEVLVRVYIVTLGIVATALAIFFRASQIITTEGEALRKQAAKKMMVYREVKGERGNILSEDGSLLATSIPYFNAYWDARTAASKIKDEELKKGLDTLSWCMSTYISPQSTPDDWRNYFWQELQKKGQYSLIAKNLTYDQLKLLRTFPIFRKDKNTGGLIYVQEDKRAHPFKMLALRTLGYVKDDEGQDIRVGLEGKFYKQLSGNAQRILMRRLPGGDMYIPVEDLSDIEPPNAADLVTTIDVNIQDITQTALLRALNAHQAEHGTAIVMEVKTGKIKAIANIGLTPEGYWEDYNYGIGRAIEPGSTMKLASLMSLLEDGFVKLSDTIDIENGKTQYFNETLEDAERFGKRFATVRQVFAHSSNVGVSKMVYQNYKDKPQAFVKHLRDFMLTLPTGIEIEGEAPPYIKNPDNAADNWSGTTLPWMSIGYELQLTPLQMLNFFNTVANGGTVMKPYLVNEIQRYGVTEKRYAPIVVKKRIASQATLYQMKELLEAVVQEGTAAHLRTPQYRFAGKTGTAQLNYEKLSKTKQKIGGHQASFCGFFPVENPIYSCIVVAHKPKSGIYGGIVAAPVFREIADRLMASNVALSEPVNEKGKPVASATTLPNDVGFKDDLIKAMTNFNLKYEIATKDDDWTFLKAKGDTLHVLPRAMMNKKCAHRSLVWV
ncbi:MAG: penicillin-binding protein 2 [Saprospiraceae bacterium]|nr:penicillin-binding protein 2 [Saprospiraceae bacterium]